MGFYESWGMTTSSGGWTRARVSDLAVINPEQLGTSTPRDYRLAYLDIGSIVEAGRLGAFSEHLFSDAPSRARRRVRSGDVVVSTVRPYLRAFARVVDPPPNLVASTGFAVLRPKDENDGPFLYQQVLSPAFADYLKSRMKGGSYPAVTADDVAGFEFLLPDPAERRKIAAILTSIDEAIELSQQWGDQLKRCRTTLQRTLFSTGLPSRHGATRETELGILPASWKVSPLTEIVVSGPSNGMSPVSRSGPPGVPTFSIGAVREGRLNFAGNLKYTDLTPEEIEKFRLRPDDVLIVRANASAEFLGRSAIVEEVPEGCIYPDLLMRVRPGPSIRPRFLSYAWNSEVVHGSVVAKAKTTNGTYKVNQSDVGSTLVPVPPIDEQVEIESILDAVEDSFSSNREVINQLSAVKGSLSQRLLSGDLRVTSDEAVA